MTLQSISTASVSLNIAIRNVFLTELPPNSAIGSIISHINVLLSTDTL